MSRTPPPPGPHERPPRLIARQLAFGFGAVSLVAVAMCAMLLSIIQDVSGLIAGMRHDEATIRQGVELATAVRDMSLHIAQATLAPDAAHVARYTERRAQVRTRIQQLAPHIPGPERYRLQALGQTTQQMQELFTQAALPAARRGDAEQTREAQRELEQLGADAAAHADALARTTASRMAHAHVLATHAAGLALWGTGVCVLLVLGLSVGFTLRLRAAVLRPLQALTDAAARFGRGDFAERVGPVGDGELGQLGEAFDRMADELAHREARLLRNERMAAIGQLAAGVAHELNNPIGIVRGYLKTMSPDGDPETLREELAILDEEAAHCQRIADDLLSYARGGELSLERVQIAALLRETAARFGEAPAGSGLDLRVDVQEAELEGDGARLRQVLLNLLTNASQASPAGASVQLRGRVQDASYRIEVEDRGAGVAAEDRERIFEPFYSKRRGGSGLGLSVCLGIVRAHHGSIRVQAAEGGGTQFCVELPLKAPETASGPPRTGAA